MVGSDVVSDIKKDFDSIFCVSKEVTEEYKTGMAMSLRFGQLILRLMAPLL
jgi:hypothetical protein